MPHVIIKKVWDYCTYNKKILMFLVIMLFVSSYIQNYIQKNGTSIDSMLLQLIVMIVVSGYGMLIARSRINHGKELPKIIIKDILSLGIKSSIVVMIYGFIQTIILTYIGSELGFPLFDLEEYLINWSETLHMLFSHDPINTVVFLIVGFILFYITTFFMEIALAKLADTKSMKTALNIFSIKRNIDTVGWREYAKHYTLIVLAIVILSYMVSYDITLPFIDSIIDMFLSFLIFVTQYLGIGAVYCEIKDLENENKRE